MMLDAIVVDNDYPTVFFYALLLYMIHYRCEYVNIFILSLTLFVCEAFNIFNPHSFFILQPWMCHDMIIFRFNHYLSP